MVRQLIIDRFEGLYAICEELAPAGRQEAGKKPARSGKDLHFFGIEKSELPENAREGSVLVIGEDGTLSFDEEATAARRAKLRAMQDNLMGKPAKSKT